MELARKDKEIRKLKEQQKDGLDQIQKFIGNLGNVINKAHFFDNYIKSEV